MYTVGRPWKSMKEIQDRINEISEALTEAEYVIIGAGAGLSTASGIEYGGKRFKENFSDYIKKYNMTDMYTAGFYPFKTSEEKWGYWSKHIFLNCVNMPPTPLYEKLYDLVRDKNFFVITTNVDEQFRKSGFPMDKVHAIQGSYNLLQCSRPCHDKLYDNTNTIRNMVENIDENLKIPTELIPLCPKCGRQMENNLRADDKFVEDKNWHKQNHAYEKFLEESKDHKTVLLEFGVGYNTPGIIRFPFDFLTTQQEKWTLVRFNRSHLELGLNYHKTIKLLSVDAIDKYNLPNNMNKRYIPVSEDIEMVIDELLKKDKN